MNTNFQLNICVNKSLIKCLCRNDAAECCFKINNVEIKCEIDEILSMNTQKLMLLGYKPKKNPAIPR